MQRLDHLKVLGPLLGADPTLALAVLFSRHPATVARLHAHLADAGPDLTAIAALDAEDEAAFASATPTTSCVAYYYEVWGISSAALQRLESRLPLPRTATVEMTS